MKHPRIRLPIAIAMTAGIAFGLGCETTRDRDNRADDAGKTAQASLAKMPEAPRAAVERLTAGGQLRKIDREFERGRSVYDVEATVDGKPVEYTIAEADGEVLGTETRIEYGQLPEPVRVASGKFFDDVGGLTAMKGVEYGETSYELGGLRKGRKVEATFNPAGERIE